MKNDRSYVNVYMCTLLIYKQSILVYVIPS